MNHRSLAPHINALTDEERGLRFNVRLYGWIFPSGSPAGGGGAGKAGVALIKRRQVQHATFMENSASDVPKKKQSVLLKRVFVYCVDYSAAVLKMSRGSRVKYALDGWGLVVVRSSQEVPSPASRQYDR